MTEVTDPFEILHALRPADDRRRIEIGELPDADALLAQIFERDAPAVAFGLGRSRRRWMVAASVVTGSLVATSAAAAVLWQNRTTDHRVLACYSAASIDADRYEMQIDAGDDPVAACAVLWTDGTFATAGQPVSQACSTSTGTAAVVPGDGTFACTQAGLGVFDRVAVDDETLEEQRKVDRLSTHLAETFLAECHDEQASMAEAESALRDERLEEWTVAVPEPFTAARQCGVAIVEEVERTIVIVARPPAPEGD